MFFGQRKLSAIKKLYIYQNNCVCALILSFYKGFGLTYRNTLDKRRFFQKGFSV